MDLSIFILIFNGGAGGIPPVQSFWIDDLDEFMVDSSGNRMVFSEDESTFWTDDLDEFMIDNNSNRIIFSE